jgi:[acyl-carrier-protein] S-malonyltransferase
VGLGIICTGQGNQNGGMFSGLANYSQLDAQLNVLSKRLGCEILPQIALGNECLFGNQYAQPLIASLTFLQWQLLKDELELPVAFAGYSLGELSAYACSGACDFMTLLDLAQTRANLMNKAAQQSAESGLLAVSGLPQRVLTNLIQEHGCYLAIVNAPDSCVLGGIKINLQHLGSKIMQSYPMAKLTELKVELASHTPVLSAASVEFEEYLAQQMWQPLSAPIIASIDNQVIYAAKDGLGSLSRQISETIYFSRTIQIMYELGASVILELGSGKSLSAIVNNLQLPLKVRSFNDFNNVTGVIQWVQKNLRT